MFQETLQSLSLEKHWKSGRVYQFVKKSDDFLKTVKPFIEQFGPEHIYNSDQSGFQLEIHSIKLLCDQRVKIERIVQYTTGKIQQLNVYGFRILLKFC